MKIKKLLPTVIGFIVIIIVWNRIDQQAILNLIKESDYTILSTAMAICLVNFFISALRWRLILNQMGSSVRLWRLIQYLFESVAVNLLIPSGIGGELSKAIRVNNETSNLGSSYASVATDKIIALSAFVTIVALGVLLEWYPAKEFDIVFPLLLSVMILAIVSLFFYSAAGNACLTFVIKKMPKIMNVFEAITLNMQLSKKKPLLFIKIYLLAILGLVIQVTSTWAVGSAIGIEISFWFYFILVPLIGLLTAIPISNSGIGIREGLFVIAFSYSDVAEEPAFALSIIWTLLAIIIPGIIGAVCLIISTRNRPIEN